MHSQSDRVASVLRLATLALLWGSGFLLIKIALRGFTPFEIVLVRLALGGLVLAAYLWIRRIPLPRDRLTWLHLSVAAALANVAPYLLFAIAERQIDSTVAGMINATTPLFTIILAILVRHESRPSGIRLLGLSVGLVGTAILLSPWRLGSQFTSLGALAALTASLCYAVSYIYMDRFLAKRQLSPITLSSAQLMMATAITALGAPIPGSLAQPAFRLDAVISLITLGVLGTGVAYVLNYRIIASDGASAASVVTYLLPVTAVILGAVVLNESPTLHAIVGMLIVLLGVGLTQHRIPRRLSAEESTQHDASDYTRHD
jgi:drug/metabolite transporter (DMT)-like permease